MRPMIRACIRRWWLLAGALGAALAMVPVVAAETPDRWAVEMAAFAAADREQPPVAGSVVFVGSSSIRLWKTLAQDFPELAPVNRGFGGSEIADSVAHFDVLIRPHAPRLVVFYAGTNDVAAGKEAARVAGDFEVFCSMLHAEFPSARIVFLSVVPAPSRWALRETMAELNRRVADYCAQDERRQFVDVASVLMDADGLPLLENFADDRLHLSPAGYALWRQVVGRALRDRRGD